MEYGKFKTAQDLLDAYNNLEKTFTQKCQRVSQLEKMIEKDVPSNQTMMAEQPNPPQKEVLPCQTSNLTDGTSEQSPPTDTASAQPQQPNTVPQDVTVLEGKTVASNAITAEQLLQYVKDNRDEIAKIFGEERTATPTIVPKVMAGGGNVTMALPNKPRTIKEASIIAQDLFKNR